MKNVILKTISCFTFAGLLSPLGHGMAGATPTLRGVKSIIAEKTVVTNHGKVYAKVVPLSQVGGENLNKTASPTSGSAFDGIVSMDIDGDGWYMAHWSIAGQPLLPGQCTYSTYWFPGDRVSFFGPDLCNTSSENGMYWSDAQDIYVNGNAFACSTILGMPGKPCVWVWR